MCLPEFPEKIERTKAYFAENGLENVEFFWGLHAETAGLSTEHTYELDNPGSGWRLGYNPTGIWLGHYMLWDTLAHLPYDHVMIVETDMRFGENWKARLDQALEDAPRDFDLLYPGSCCVEGHPKTHVKGDVWETKHIQCTHCYIVRRAALSNLLRMRKIWAPVDIQMQLECFAGLKTYAVLPRIFDQHDMTLTP